MRAVLPLTDLNSMSTAPREIHDKQVPTTKTSLSEAYKPVARC